MIQQWMHSFKKVVLLALFVSFVPFTALSFAQVIAVPATPVPTDPLPKEYLLFFQEAGSLKMAHFDNSGLVGQPIAYDQNQSSGVMNTFHSFNFGNTVKTIAYKMPPIGPRYIEYCQFNRTNVQARQCFNLTQPSAGLLELTLAAKQDDQGNVYVFSIVDPNTPPYQAYLDMVKIDSNGQQVLAVNVAQSQASEAEWIDFSLVPYSNPPQGVVARQGASPRNGAFPPILDLYTVNLTNGTLVQYDDLTSTYSPPAFVGRFIWEVKVLAGGVLPTGQPEIFLFFTAGNYSVDLAYRDPQGIWQPSQPIAFSALDAELYPTTVPQQQILFLTYNKQGNNNIELWSAVSVDSLKTRVVNFRSAQNVPAGDVEMLSGQDTRPIATMENTIKLRLSQSGQITQTIPVGSTHGTVGNSPIVELP